MTMGKFDETWLLVSDVDDTLTGDDVALAALGEALLQHRHDVRVVLNSSRPAPSIARTRATVFPPGFPVDAVITALGTEIAVGEVVLPEWSARFVDWPGDAIFRAVAAMGHRPHDAEFQTSLKVSFSVAPEARQQVGAALLAQGLPCRIIFSGSSDLDIIPPGAGKDAAALFLAVYLGIPEGRLVVAGDSGNDLAMFAVASQAIAVGNARGELIAQMPVNHSYHATGRFAAGVLEGLVHFGVLRDGKLASAV
jgi:sucrose-6F-phosphate phosphohydrolase